MYLTATHAQVRDTACRFAGEVIRPVAKDPDRDERFPGELHAQMARLGPGRAAPHHRTGDPGRRRDAGPRVPRRVR